MTDFILKLLGAHGDEGLHVVNAALSFRGGVGLGWVIFLMLVLGVMVVIMYRQSPPYLSAARKYLLMSLRLVFIALLLAILLRPVVALTVEGSIRRALVLLLDGSASMRIADPRRDPADQQRLATAVGAGGPASRSPSGQVARIDVVKAALQNPRLNLVPRLEREFDLAAFTFGQGLMEISTRGTNVPARARGDQAATNLALPWVQGLRAGQEMTGVGDALREAMNRKRGQPLAGMLLVTDGAHNHGVPPREIAALLREERVPLYIYGVGITKPRDLIVSGLTAPDVTFVDDEALAMVRVRSQGYGEHSAEVVLKLAGEPAATVTVDFSGDGEQIVPLRFVPPRQGDLDIEASIASRPDETVAENNSRSQRLRVIDARIQVLLADQAPRWEYRYLEAMLLRDRRVDLKCYLAEGDPGIARGEQTPYIAAFPSRKDELFAYDVIIWGDLDPASISITQLENLNEWVSRFGGAFISVAGRRHNPAAYKRTRLEQMLPVEFESAGITAGPEPLADKPIQVELTASGRASPLLRLAEREDENLSIWKQLPPIYWAARVARPKPAAEVLMVHPDPARETRFGKMPILVQQQYGLGQVMFVGTDNLWRWRKNVGDLYHTTLWGQMIQGLSRQRMLGSSKRTQLTADHQNYLGGDRVSVYARLYGVGYEPVQQPAIKAFYGFKNGKGQRSETVMRPVPEQPGLYRVEFIAGAPGHYQFLVEPDLNTPLEFTVLEPRFELAETALNEPLLRDLASISGGAFFREEDLHRIPDTIARGTERVRSPLEIEVWASPLYFILLLGIVGVEWVLRKFSYLK